MDVKRSDIMLRCGPVVEFFEAVSTVPVAARAPALGPPLFARLLPALLARAQYPRGFASWEDCAEDDADGFHRFRRVRRLGSFDCTRHVVQHCLTAVGGISTSTAGELSGSSSS